MIPHDKEKFFKMDFLFHNLAISSTGIPIPFRYSIEVLPMCFQNKHNQLKINIPLLKKKKKKKKKSKKNYDKTDLPIELISNFAKMFFRFCQWTSQNLRDGRK